MYWKPGPLEVTTLEEMRALRCTQAARPKRGLVKCRESSTEPIENSRVQSI